VVVSSDAREMADGLPWVKRPSDISGETADIADATAHALITRERETGQRFELVITLQPTVPVRDGRLVRRMVEAMRASDCRGALTGVPIVPWVWRARGEVAENGWTPNPYPRSQSFAGEMRWQEINAVQIADRDTVIGRRRWALPLLIQLLPSYAALDIDDAHDLARARVALEPLLTALAADQLDEPLIIRSINGHTNLG
jgi:CMP-N-acetylneuraminic acid synthetase